MKEHYECLNRGSNYFPISIHERQDCHDEAHHHLEYEILYISEGSVLLCIEGQNVLLKEGCAVFIYPEINHCIKSVSEDEKCNYYVLKFDISALGDERNPCREFFYSIRIKRFFNLPDVVTAQICYISRMNREHAAGIEIMIKALLLTIISYIIVSKQYEVACLCKKNIKHTSSAIDSAIDYIHNHYNENIAIDDVLSVTNYSKSHFLRIFKKTTHSTVNEYITKYRIEKACIDLIYSQKNITEIASEHGYNNIQYFSRRFKEYMECTPKQYQKKGRNLVTPPCN